MASIMNWPDQAKGGSMAEDVVKKRFEFQVINVTVRAVRTVPVVGNNGDTVPYSSDTSDVILVYSPSGVIPSVVIDADSVEAVFSELAKIASNVVAFEVKRKGTEDRYSVDGATRKIVPL